MDIEREGLQEGQKRGVRKNKVGEAGRPPLDYISRDAQQEGAPRPTRPLPTGTAGAAHPVEPSGALRLQVPRLGIGGLSLGAAQERARGA